MAQITPGASRFAGASRTQAGIVIALWAAILLASLWSAMTRPARPDPPQISASTADRDEDLDLYRRISARIRLGEAYYPVAADEQRRNHYPLRPFVTMRLPTLALLIAHIGIRPAHLLLLMLAILTVIIWYRRLRAILPPAVNAAAMAALLLPGMTLLASPTYVVLHEVWAGILIALALAVHRPDQWGRSLVIAGCALAMRELALPFVLLMGAAALVHRRWAEIGGWALLVLGFGVLCYGHMVQVMAVVRPDDLASPPWTEFGGLPAALAFLHQSGGFRAFPAVIGYPLIMVCLFGWISWRSDLGGVGTLLLLGYGLGFALTGRANNFYWGLLIAPLVPMGLPWLRPACADLMTALQRRQLDSRPD